MSKSLFLCVTGLSFLLVFCSGCSSPTSTPAPVTTYSITYDGNGNIGGSVPVDSATYAEGSSVTVLGNTGNLTKTYNAFAGWNTMADGSGTAYSAGGTFAMGSANIKLYAQWTSTVGSGAVTATAPSEVTITLTLGSSTVTSGNPITATVTTSVTVDSLVWYLDDSVVSDQTTASFSGGTSLVSGPHTLMVVVRKDGVAYSANACVSVK